MITLSTWAGRSKFSYIGSINEGTTIFYGNNYSVKISSEQYSKLLYQFKGLRVNIGSSRTDTPKGSVGDWLMSNVTKTAIASYVGPILIAEGYAKKIRGPLIEFKNEIF